MGVKERKEREKKLRRKDILNAAEKLFSSKKGLSATMDDLAEKTELSKGTLYLYFKNKDHLLQELALKGILLLKKRLRRNVVESQSGIEQLSAVGDTFVEFLKDKPFYSDLLLRFEKTIVVDEEQKRLPLVEPILDILAFVLKKGIQDKTIRQDVEINELVTILWSQMLGILNTLSGRKEILKIYNIDEEWIIRGHFRVILSGLSSNGI